MSSVPAQVAEITVNFYREVATQLVVRVLHPYHVGADHNVGERLGEFC